MRQKLKEIIMLELNAPMAQLLLGSNKELGPTRKLRSKIQLVLEV